MATTSLAVQRLPTRIARQWAAVFDDHFQEHETAATGRSVELEIQGPHLVGVLSPIAQD
jgi:hypothetical protein